jgi:hypothetical protein
MIGDQNIHTHLAKKEQEPQESHATGGRRGLQLEEALVTSQGRGFRSQ